MKNDAERILEELYEIDSSLREQGEELNVTVKKLLKSKPKAVLDRSFEKNLKMRLVKTFPAPSSAEKIEKKSNDDFATKRKGLRTVVMSPAFRIASTALAACLVVVLFFRFGPTQKSTNEGLVGDLQLQSTAQAASKPDANTREKSAAAADTKKQGSPSNAVSDRLTQTDSRKMVSPAMPAQTPLPTTAQNLEEKDSTNKTFFLGFSDSNGYDTDFNIEDYDAIVENSFIKTIEEPLSTFSIDVDTASYANVRRYLERGGLPPPGAVRIEELVNYFEYDYPEPDPGESFAFHPELALCPWNPDHLLLRVALQARRIPSENLPPSNLVFLVDVSGSMDEQNKLPLVKESLKLLVRNMRKQDRISVVVYAGSAGLVLPSTPGSDTKTIFDAIDRLEAGGSTAGGEGIELAYSIAKKYYMRQGNNRVIIATDGDFNVGPSSDDALVRLIEKKRKEGIFLSVLGFGMGNYKDSKMQKLADSGNGNYAYIDSLFEAEKVLSRQMAGTLYAVAKDVKIQIEFNPAVVGEYRLIGYEKRVLATQDFADDGKDAGELGSGSSVTAFYEIIPSKGAAPRTDLKYQSTSPSNAAASGELMTIKFRYKKPDADESVQKEMPVKLEPKTIASASEDFRFAASVAEFGLLLRDSKYKGKADWNNLITRASQARGPDTEGYRAEFVRLAKIAQKIASTSE